MTFHLPFSSLSEYNNNQDCNQNNKSRSYDDSYGKSCCGHLITTTAVLTPTADVVTLTADVLTFTTDANVH